MTPALLGKKIGMTRVYDAAGKVIPVTVVECQPNAITQIKTVETDGYNAVQLGFDDIRAKLSNFPLIGHCAKAGVGPKRSFAEIRLKSPTDKKAGEAVAVGIFDGVQYVDVIGTSKGKGFAGAMKRHHFGGQPASHGTERKHRSRGSICSYASNRGHTGKPKKGLRMAGHMGNERVTCSNLALVKVDAEKNVLLIKGAVPGFNGGLVFVRKALTARDKKPA